MAHVHRVWRRARGPAGRRCDRVCALGGATALNVTERLKAQAYGLGFDLAGVADLGTPASVAHFDAWLAQGFHGNMTYLDGDGAQLRRDAQRPHPGATHALVVAMNYDGTTPSGPVARYARGDDYHDVLRSKLRELHAWLEREVGHAVNARPYVDSGPLLERDLAQRAGLGWFGKNTCLINPKLGSFFFLASLVVELKLDVDAPFEADRCGTCTRCLEACPTQAFTAARALDATRCISYLTIELREAIPEALREQVGALLYGCDVCQDVCPWNVSFAQPSRVDAFAARDLIAHKDARAFAREVLQMEPSDYAAQFRGSAIKRAKLWMLKRNACVVLGNEGTADDLPLLAIAEQDAHAIVREHARWAVQRLGAGA